MSQAGSERLSREELLTRQFYEWEIRGRGWQVYDQPVELEPAFRPFWFHTIPRTGHSDDARKPTIFSSIVEGIFKRKEECADKAAKIEEELEEQPKLDEEQPEIVEFQIAVPATMKISKEITELFLFSLDTCSGPVSFEVIGTEGSVVLQFASRDGDAPYIASQLAAYFPDVTVRQREGTLADIWDTTEERQCALLDLGLCREFMLPLAVPKNLDADPLIALVGSLSNLKKVELGMLQVLFSPLRRQWVPSIWRAATDNEGNCFFADAPNFLKSVREKISKPLYAVSVRLAAQSPSGERCGEILRNIGGALSQFSDPTGNEFIPLDDESCPIVEHILDVLSRRSHRSGMILNSEELACLAHLPSVSVRSDKLERAGERTKTVPSVAVVGGLVLGENIHAGVTTTVSVTQSQRLRHTYVLGASGTGKSTFLLNCILQDIKNGEGIGVLDPHGDLIDRIVESIPDDRINDVVLVDPSDEEYPIGFNILSAHSDLERNLLSSDLVSVFRRLSTSWGDQMSSVLGNAVLAFLESNRGGTLIELRRFLVDSDFRKGFLETVTDPDIVYYWQREYPLLSGKPQAPLLTRLDTFLRPKLIRRMVGQKENKIDFRSIMDGSKIFLAKLSQGAIGEENSYLLGTLLVAKFHQMAIARQDVKETNRKPFYLYIDEFQDFITPSTASILSGARKYGLGLVLAHQDLRQLWSEDTQLANAVIANPCTRICFRLGDFDAEKLQDGFSYFTASDLQNLGTGEAICRVERAEYDFNLTTLPIPEPQTDADLKRQKVMEHSRSRYATKRTDIQDESPVAASRPEPAIPSAVQPKELPTATTPTPKTESPKPRSGKSHMPSAPELPGRGGAQHKYLQQLLKRMAESQGYRATIEQEILGGSGKIDVALERDTEQIACEISVSSTEEHEFENVQKCIAAGYSVVVLLSAEKKVLGRMREFISERLGGEQKDLVHFLTPDEFFSYLEQRQAAAASSEQTIRGYRVKVNYQALADEEKNVKKQAVSNVIVQAMRRLKE
jgi:hypothetical protein